ncbi:anti-sigma factor family protein [Mycoplana rhizolycopersici]|uniref:Anti-sigma factor n=1 Tax=Mycoplana rhizolycopersici TaxID=2746702 RepID=A0ABX2QF54_9HYPH|nr:anti-sigma factor [Rhizobium rhizolycopersici]NVP56395.1 anti-sigma factor [Rhizobium rhizolycopersici]
MTQATGTIGENDLHAFVDGLLDEGRRAEVEAWLETNPQDAERVASWSSQNERIREVFAGDFVSRGSDAEMLRRNRPLVGSRFTRPAIAAAAALLIFAAGFGSGRLTMETIAPPSGASTTSLAQEARSAFLVYTSEVRHPVEVGADQQEHLAAWLGKRLDYRLRLPDLSALGYSLVGGRLLPVGGRPGALLMYQNAGGQRLTMIVGRNAENRETSFRLDTDGPIRTFYWIDGAIGYAVTGEIPANDLRAVADECYRQMEEA